MIARRAAWWRPPAWRRDQRGILWTPSTAHAFRADNWGTNPSDSAGTSVTPGASHAEGSWTQVLAAVGGEVRGIAINVFAGGTSANIKNHLLDIGIDPAGGSSYTALIENIPCGATNPITNGTVGQAFFFPIRIPSGSTVAVRIQGSNGTAGTVRVCVAVFGSPGRPHLLPVGQYSETIGTITNTSGVSFTPGNAADGSWVDLGATTRDLWWWQLGYQLESNAMTAERTYIELGIGDASNKQIITRLMHTGTTGETLSEIWQQRLLWHANYWPTPAGTHVYVRGRCQNAPDSGYTALAVGVGG